MNRRLIRGIFVGGGLLLALVLPFVYRSNSYVMDLGISIMIWAAVAQSWNLLAGMGGMWSLGHTVFFGVGAYVTAYFGAWGIPTLLGFPAGLACAVILAFVLGWFVCRMSGHYFTLVTFVFTVGMGVIVRYFNEYTGGDYGMSVPLYMHPSGLLNLSWGSQLPYYFTALVITLLIFLIVWAIARSGFGYKLAAVREDSRSARALGINVFHTRLITFVIGSGLASLSGTIYVCYYKLIDPSSAFSIQTALYPVIYTIGGGVGSLFGGIVGTSILVPLSSYLNQLADQLPGIDRIVYGMLLMLFTLLLPSGVMGLGKRWRAKQVEE